MASAHPNHNTVFRLYFLTLYLIVLAGLSAFTSFTEIDQGKLLLFMISAVISYPAVYLFIPALTTKICLTLFSANNAHNAWQKNSCYIVAWLSSTMVLIFLFADYNLFKLYDYHFNKFVWNLITTPGGIASLGATTSTNVTYTIEVAAIAIANAAILIGIKSLVFRQRLPRLSAKKFALVVAILLITLVGEETVTAYSQYVSDAQYYEVISIIPLHLESKASTLFRALNIEHVHHNEIKLAKGDIRYPLAPLTITKQAQPNIVWLTAESFRWDLLDPEITPNLWKFAQKCSTFENHYSGGNRTRMGMLSMFYGLYAPYWYQLQKQQVRPVLMDHIIQSNYQLSLNTSQSFSYPELNDTVFAHISDQYKHELTSGPAWLRDQDNTTDIISFIEKREPQRPFFSFLFYESTHAPYDFPDKAVIRTPYLDDVNYARITSRLNDIEPLHNRYINAAHHIDAEVGRLLDKLEQLQLLDNTIVLFTGDHGEEFMEKGHWGHGHTMSFPSYQVRVPLVLWLPKEPAQKISRPTSHLQLPATLLSRLGVTNPYSDYSSAPGLFKQQLPYLVVGNHDDIGIIAEHSRISFPFTSNHFFRYVVRDSNDDPVTRSEKDSVTVQMQPSVKAVLSECNRFLAPSN